MKTINKKLILAGLLAVAAVIPTGVGAAKSNAGIASAITSWLGTHWKPVATVSAVVGTAGSLFAYTNRHKLEELWYESMDKLSYPFARIFGPTGYRRIVLSRALAWGCSVKTFEMLLAKATNDEKHHALCYASYIGNLDAAKKIIESKSFDKKDIMIPWYGHCPKSYYPVWGESPYALAHKNKDNNAELFNYLEKNKIEDQEVLKY